MSVASIDQALAGLLAAIALLACVLVAVVLHRAMTRRPRRLPLPRAERRKCDGLRVPTRDGMRQCLRCGCTSCYAPQYERLRCPVLRTRLWKPRPTTDGRWAW